MGNAEMRRMTEPTPVLGPEMRRLQSLHATFQGDFVVDRTTFSNLFDPTKVSYSFIDEVFKVFDTNEDGSVQLSEIVLGICFSMRPQCRSDVEESLKERLGFLFQVFDHNGDKLLTRAELITWLQKVVKESITRQRKYLAATQGKMHSKEQQIFGIPHVAPTVKAATSEQQATWQTHIGFECTGCSTSPVIGNLYLSESCLGTVALCQKCIDNNVPLGTNTFSTRSMVRRDRAWGLERLVQDFVERVFAEGDLNGDGYLSQSEFVEWGLRNEMVLRLMSGATIHDVRLCEYQECAVEDRRELMWAESVGIVPASDV